MNVYPLHVQGSNRIVTRSTAWSPGQNLVVTAWHNVGTDGRWHSELDSLAKYWLEVDDAPPVYLHPVGFDSKHDLAVLGITGRPPTRVIPIACLVPTPPTIIGKVFKTQGYADAAPGSGLVSADGKVMQLVRGDKYPIQLAIEHSDIDDYAGFSGAPLVVDDIVVGILPWQTGPKGLRAVPTDWLHTHMRCSLHRTQALRVAWSVAIAIVITYLIVSRYWHPSSRRSSFPEQWELVFSTMTLCGPREPLLVYDGNNRAVPIGPSYVGEHGQLVAIRTPERIEFAAPRHEVTWSCGTDEKHNVTSPAAFDAVTVERNVIHVSFSMYRRR